MDKYMKHYKAAVESVTAENDITGKAKARIAQKANLFSVKHIVAAACAITVMGGTAVYAVHIGWLNDLFGGSCAVISENSSDYSVSISEYSVSRADDNFPYDVTLKDVICDGSILYGELHITDKTGDAIYRDDLSINADVILNGNEMTSGWTGFIFLNENEDGSADAAFYSIPETKMSAGDSVKVMVGNSEADELTGTSISFDILSMPRALAKHYEIDSTAKFTSYYGEMTEAEIVNMEISPLHLKINGHCENFDSVLIIQDSYECSINFNDGSYLYIENRKWTLNTDISGGQSVVDQNDSYCDTYSFGSAHIDGSNEYDFDIEVPFRCVLPVEAIESVTVGDLVIPVNG